MKSAAILVCLLAALCAGSCKSDDEGSAGEVVVYCSVDQKFAETVIAEFEKQTGIDVRPVFDTEASKSTGLARRLEGEKDRPRADVFWSSEVFHTIRLARAGVLAAYDGPAAKDWPARFKDDQGRWYGFALRGRVIAYNTKTVSAEEAPRSLEDLLDPKWKKRICIANPAFGTTGGHVASWFAQYGPDRAEEILRGLKANDIHIAKGNSDAVQRIARGGRVAICLTDTDDVYVAQRNGLPVAMNFCDQGGAGVLVIPNTAAMIKGGPNPTQAARLMEFLLSAKLERMLAESDSQNTPVHPDAAKEYPENAIGNQLKVDYEKIADEFARGRVSDAGKILEESN